MPRAAARGARNSGTPQASAERLRGKAWRGVGVPHIPDESAGAYDKTGAMIKPCLLDIKALLRLCHVHALEV